ncbi:MAG: hypothetical protein ACE5EE_05270 [Fidelibacterota bacterium]
MSLERTAIIIIMVFSGFLVAQEKLTIKEDSPIYAEPDNESRVIAYGIAGDKAEVLEYKDDFFLIRYNSFGFTYEGYIQSSAIKGKKPSIKSHDDELDLTKVPEKAPSVLKTPLSSLQPIPEKRPAMLIRPDPEALQRNRFFFSDCLWLVGATGVVYGGWELTNRGYVVLGRDIMAGSILTWLLRTKLVRNRRSWGSLETLEVTAQPYDVAGWPKWQFTPGEQGQVVLTIINRGDKRVKGIHPRIRLKSSVLQKQFGKLKVRRGSTEGRRRYLIGGFTLDPGESMTIATTFQIPSTYPSTTIEIKGSLTRTLYGTAQMEVGIDELLPLMAQAEEKPVIALLDVERNIPQTTSNHNAYGIVFGIEQYKNVSPVTYARRDAHWVREYFEKTLGIPKENIYYLTDSDVSKAELDKVFSLGGWLDKRVLDGVSDIYIYYAGHGAPDISNRTAYLIPYDGDPNYASQTGYEVDELTRNLSQLGARSVTVFLDACFTGANRENEILLAGARPIFMEVNPSMAENVTLFSAASGTEISSAWPEKQHGLFTYWLLKGLQGKADTDQNNNLTVQELGDYIRENVSITAGKLDREQTPVLQTRITDKVVVEY